MKNNFYQINIGERIKKFRLQSNLSVKEVQSLLHSYGYPISFQGFYKWENNQNIPSITHIIILCDIFNITTSTFLNDSPSYNNNISKREIEFISTFRENEYFKHLVTILYKKEVNKYGKDWTKIKNA